MTKFAWEVPIKTVSEANCSENRWIKQKRHQTQQRLIRAILGRNLIKITLPCVIKLTRLATRELDDDCIAFSLKWIRDEIGAHIFPEKVVSYTTKSGLRIKNKGFTDNDKRIKWEYAQEKSRIMGIRIEVDCED